MCLYIVLFASDKELSANIYKRRVGSAAATSSCADITLCDSVVTSCAAMFNVQRLKIILVSCSNSGHYIYIYIYIYIYATSVV